MRRPSKTHPLFRPNSPAKVQKEIKTHTSTTPHRTLRPVTGRDTRQSIPAPDTAAFRTPLARSFLRRHSEARDATAGFQIDATSAGWRCACVVPRRGAGAGGSANGGRGPEGSRDAAAVRPHCLPGSVVSPSATFRGGASGLPPWRCHARRPRTPATHADHARRPLPRHSCSLPGCADDGLSLGRVPVAVSGGGTGWGRRDLGHLQLTFRLPRASSTSPVLPGELSLPAFRAPPPG